MKLITLWAASFFSAAVDATTDQDGLAGFWSLGATRRAPIRLRAGRFAASSSPRPARAAAEAADSAPLSVAGRLTPDGRQEGRRHRRPGGPGLTGVLRPGRPAHGYEVVHRRSAIISAGKALDAPCPAGKRALSGGARTEVDGIDQAGNGQVVLNDLTLQAGLSNVRVTALEDQDGFARAWQVKATAICAPA